VFRDGRVIAAWPTKLALAPLLAEQVEEVLRTLAVQPRPLDLRIAGGLAATGNGNSPGTREQIGMELKPLGATGLRVSPLGLGTVKFGRNQGVKYPQPFELPSDREALALLEQAWDLGINLLDTAPAYGDSEERLGRLLRQCRRDWVIVTKVGEEFRDGVSSLRFFRRRYPRQRGTQPAPVGRGSAGCGADPFQRG
jgi:hypothetical protein